MKLIAASSTRPRNTRGVVIIVKILVFTTFLIINMFLMACSTDQPQPPQQTVTIDSAEVDGELTAADEYWAKDNFDLGRVGELIEESDDPAEFEAYLNSDEGINNLDLNGDGYADYISVEEFDDRYDDQRGLSLFTRFGPDIIQEIATIVFHRDDYNAPGARILLTGNPQLYGDNYYYETNWLDRSLGLASLLFRDDRDIYRSPYYYDNYPDWYDPYYIVETPVYRNRVVQLYPEPLFVYTTQPSFYDRIEIRSPYDGRWIDRVYARMVNPTREQEEFLRNNRVPPARGRRDMADGPGFSEDAPGQRKKVEGEQSANPGRGNPDKGNPNKPDKADKDQGGPPPKADRGKPDNNPGKVQDNPGKGNPNKPEKPQKADNPNKGGGGDKGKGKGKGKP